MLPNRFVCFMFHRVMKLHYGLLGVLLCPIFAGKSTKVVSHLALLIYTNLLISYGPQRGVENPITGIVASPGDFYFSQFIG